MHIGDQEWNWWKDFLGFWEEFGEAQLVGESSGGCGIITLRTHAGDVLLQPGERALVALDANGQFVNAKKIDR